VLAVQLSSLCRARERNNEQTWKERGIDLVVGLSDVYNEEKERVM
jgi:hypothetical protein